jgi:hypothetical protein
LLKKLQEDFEKEQSAAEASPAAVHALSLLTRAFDAVHQLALEINASERANEGKRKLVELNAKIRGLTSGESVLEAHRKYVADAAVVQVHPDPSARKQLEVWLTSDAVILLSAGSGKVKGWINIADMLSFHAFGDVAEDAIHSHTKFVDETVVQHVDRCISIESASRPSISFASDSATSGSAVQDRPTPGHYFSNRKTRQSFTPQAARGLASRISRSFSFASPVASTNSIPSFPLPAQSPHKSAPIMPADVSLLIIEFSDVATKAAWAELLNEALAARNRAAASKMVASTALHHQMASPTPSTPVCEQVCKRQKRSAGDYPLLSSVQAAALKSNVSAASILPAMAPTPTATPAAATPARAGLLGQYRDHVSPDSVEGPANGLNDSADLDLDLDRSGEEERPSAGGAEELDLVDAMSAALAAPRGSNVASVTRSLEAELSSTSVSAHSTSSASGARLSGRHAVQGHGHSRNASSHSEEDFNMSLTIREEDESCDGESSRMSMSRMSMSRCGGGGGRKRSSIAAGFYAPRFHVDPEDEETHVSGAVAPAVEVQSQRQSMAEDLPAEPRFVLDPSDPTDAASVIGFALPPAAPASSRRRNAAAAAKSTQRKRMSGAKVPPRRMVSAAKTRTAAAAAAVVPTPRTTHLSSTFRPVMVSTPVSAAPHSSRRPNFASPTLSSAAKKVGTGAPMPAQTQTQAQTPTHGLPKYTKKRHVSLLDGHSNLNLEPLVVPATPPPQPASLAAVTPSRTMNEAAPGSRRWIPKLRTPAAATPNAAHTPMAHTPAQPVTPYVTLSVAAIAMAQLDSPQPQSQPQALAVSNRANLIGAVPAQSGAVPTKFAQSPASLHGHGHGVRSPRVPSRHQVSHSMPVVLDQLGPMRAQIAAAAGGACGMDAEGADENM